MRKPAFYIFAKTKGHISCVFPTQIYWSTIPLFSKSETSSSVVYSTVLFWLGRKPEDRFCHNAAQILFLKEAHWIYYNVSVTFM